MIVPLIADVFVPNITEVMGFGLSLVNAFG